MIDIGITTWDDFCHNAIIVDACEWVQSNEVVDGHIPGYDALIGLRRHMIYQCIADTLDGVVRRHNGKAIDVKVLIPDPSPLRAKLLELRTTGDYDGAHEYLKGEWLDAARKVIGAMEIKT